jgi:hypothetical protein
MGFAQNLITCLVCTNGRLAIAGAFIAGKRGFAKKSAKRTAERVDIWHLRSAVRFTDCISLALIPAVNCWAIVSRPLGRTGRNTFCAKPS